MSMNDSPATVTPSEPAVFNSTTLATSDDFVRNPNINMSISERRNTTCRSMLQLPDDEIQSEQSEQSMDESSNRIDESVRFLNREELDSYDYLLKSFIKNAGKNAFGVTGIEVWMLDKSDERLKYVSGARWRDPDFQIDENEDTELLSKLDDKSADGYLPPIPVIEGVGVAGTLFAIEKGNLSDSATWHDLHKLEMDQHEPLCERLPILAQFFESAMGIYFEHCATGTAGIVIYFARHSAGEEEQSQSTDHNYLWATANMIGSIVSWDQPRVEAGREIDAILKIAKTSWAHARFKMKIVRLFSSGIVKVPREKEKRPSICAQFFHVICKKSKRYFKKFKGGEYKIPPGMMWSQIIFVFLGCLSSLLTLSLINEAIKRSNAKLNIILVPLGALISCHYGLTSAPATQPRNAVFGSVFSSVIAIASTYIPVNILPIWLRSAIVPALTMIATLKLGLVHPPAGSMAVLFASQEEADWMGFLLLTFGYVMANIYAVLFINLHGGSVFPVYWGFPKIPKWCFLLRKREDGTKAQDTGKTSDDDV